MISKQSVSWNRIKHFCLNLLIKILLYIVGTAMVLILIISGILSLFIYLLIGDYGFDRQIDKKYRLSVNHFNEQRTVNSRCRTQRWNDSKGNP